MTTLTLRPANAVVSMALWRTALAVVYAVIAIEVFIVAQTMISHKTLPMPTFSKHGSISRSFLAFGKNVAAQKHTRAELNIVYGLAAAVFMAGYLHLKLSVDSGARNRLSKFKGRAVSEETTYADAQREHIFLGDFVASAKVITEEQLNQALELSRRTHRLLGDIIISLGLLTSAEVERALTLQQRMQARKISREQALLVLANAVSERKAQSTKQKTEVQAPKSEKKITGFDIPIRHFSTVQPSAAPQEGEAAASFSTLPDIFGKVSSYETIDGHRIEVTSQPEPEPGISETTGVASAPSNAIITQDLPPVLNIAKRFAVGDTVEDWDLNSVKQEWNSWESARSILFDNLPEEKIAVTAIANPTASTCTDILNQLFGGMQPAAESDGCDTPVDFNITDAAPVRVESVSCDTSVDAKVTAPRKSQRTSERKAKRASRKRK